MATPGVAVRASAVHVLSGATFAAFQVLGRLFRCLSPHWGVSSLRAEALPSHGVSPGLAPCLAHRKCRHLWLTWTLCGWRVCGWWEKADCSVIRSWEPWWLPGLCDANLGDQCLHGEQEIQQDPEEEENRSLSETWGQNSIWGTGRQAWSWIHKAMKEGREGGTGTNLCEGSISFLPCVCGGFA